MLDDGSLQLTGAGELIPEIVKALLWNVAWMPS